MKRIILTLLFVGCTSAAPDEVHVWGSHGWIDGESDYDSRGGPLYFDGEFEGTTDTLGLGFTWYMSAPTVLATKEHRVPLPVPQPLPEEIPVTVNGASQDVWLGLIGSLTLMATAVAAYLGRRRIPVVRKWVKSDE